MTDANFEKALEELEKMRSNKDSMSQADLELWISNHPEITAECCDSTTEEVLANPSAFIAGMINDK